MENAPFCQSLLDAMPLPMFVVDQNLMVHDANPPALRLVHAEALVAGTGLAYLLPEISLLRLVRECIRTNKIQNGFYDRGIHDSSWRVTVTPLAPVEIQTETTASAAPPISETEASTSAFTAEIDASTHSQTSDAEEILTSDFEAFETAEKQSEGEPQGEKSAEVSVPVAPPLRTLYALAIEEMAGPRRLEQMQRDFLANISHELRTPLSSIRLLAETLGEAIESDPASAQQFVEKIEIETQYLSELVSELLDLTRIEAGQLPMTIAPVWSEQLIHEVRARMLPLAQRHRVSVVTEIEPGKHMVVADSRLIARVLVNLLHNAIKFTPSGGVITLGTVLQDDQQMQRFFVRDTGIGISPSDLPRVFERFYKTNRARSKDDFIGPGGGGTGLGLAIARQIIEAHGGRIMAESVPGRGSTFSFTLPLASVSV
jgi:two-component system phosphate regulon sensor histidine kinase PhoR